MGGGSNAILLYCYRDVLVVRRIDGSNCGCMSVCILFVRQCTIFLAMPFVLLLSYIPVGRANDVV